MIRCTSNAEIDVNSNGIVNSRRAELFPIYNNSIRFPIP